jgi:cytochrome P450
LDSIPRADEPAAFYVQPFEFLKRRRARCGDLFVVEEPGPIFSRNPDCVAVLAAFGAELQRAVLSDIEVFALPISAASQLELPAPLVNLNRSLHSMSGIEHSTHKRLLAGVLQALEREPDLIETVVERSLRDWRANQAIGILGEMRKLTLAIATRLLFGCEDAKATRLSEQLQTFFHLRREASSPAAKSREVSTPALIAAGEALDASLRTQVRDARARKSSLMSGLMPRLATLEVEPGIPLSEDEVIGHTNVLFMSCTEPIAVALTWILLLLSQLPACRERVRRESALLDWVIAETLRLLPPNAFMVRVTTRAIVLHGIRLPPGCELMLCPLLAHRDPQRFAQPDEFRPQRWREVKPSAFEYFPFGAGGHACVGRRLAQALLRTCVSTLTRHFELTLSEDQSIDWRLHIMLMPRADPTLTVQRAAACRRPGGRLLGPVGELVQFVAEAP